MADNPLNPQDALSDPEFYKLDNPTRVQVLSQLDPQFGKLAPAEQTKVFSWGQSQLPSTAASSPAPSGSAFPQAKSAQPPYPSVEQAVQRSTPAELQTAMERGEREGGEESGDFPTGIAPSKTVPPPGVPRPATPGLTGPYIAQGAFGPYAVPNDDDVDKGFEFLPNAERVVHGVQALAGPVKALSSYIGQTAGPEYGAGYNPDVAAKPPLTAEQSKQGAKGLEDVLRGALNFAAPVAIPAGLVRPKA